MNQSPKISVIVPIYKAEKYLNRCIDSLLAQTFSDFELLLIDDGSPDRSGDICEVYAEQDNRVRVFHKENSGVSSARQCGLDNALGEYVIHADPDDWVELDMLESLYSKACEEGADMVMCDFFINYLNRQVYCTQTPSSLDSVSVLRGLFRDIHGSCWNKLVRRKTILKYGVRFNIELSFCEDLNFNASILKNDIKISYLPKAFYHYDQYINSASLVRCNYSDEKFQSDVRLYHIMETLLYDTNVLQDCQSNMAYLVVSRGFYANIYTSKEFKERYQGYAHHILRRSGLHVYYKILYYLSCNGLYRSMQYIHNCILKCKRLFSGNIAVL